MTERTALDEFNEGWTAGWTGEALDKKRPLSYRTAYENARKARAEAEFYAGRSADRRASS